MAKKLSTHTNNKQSIARANQKRFIVVTAVIFLAQLINSVWFAATNEFWQYATPELAISVFLTILLPLILFVIAFLAIQKQPSVVRRIAQALVWVFCGMLMSSIATSVWYLTRFGYYGAPTIETILGPVIITLVGYVGALLKYRSLDVKPSVFIPSFLEKAFIGFAFLSTGLTIAYITIDVVSYGDTLLYLTYIPYMVLPTAVSIILGVIGYVRLRLVKGTSARLFHALFGVAFAQFVGSGLVSIGTTGYVNDWLPYVIIAISNIMAIIVYLMYLKRVRNRILHKEKL